MVASLYLGDGVVPVPEKIMKKYSLWQLLPGVQDNVRASSRRELLRILLDLVLQHSGERARSPQLMAYQSIIVRCYTDYEGDSWLVYDQAFRRKTAYEKCLDWPKLMPRRQCKEECGVRKLFNTRPPDKALQRPGYCTPDSAGL